PPGGEVDAVEHSEPDQHGHGARTPDQVDARIDDDGEEQDVDRVLPAKAQEDVHQAPTTASAIRTTSRIAPTARTRTARAPLPPASATAAAVPWSRSPVGRPPRSWPMNPLRDTPTSTGYPREATRSSCARSAQLCATVFPKPMPGSSTI